MEDKKFKNNDLRIREILKQQGKTMQQLADKMGINRVNLSTSLNKNPTLERLREVAQHLNVDVKDLFVSEKSTQSELLGVIKYNENVYAIENVKQLEELTARILADFTRGEKV